MDIKAALKAVFADGQFNVDALIDLIEAVVGKILGFIAGEEGYDFPAAE